MSGKGSQARAAKAMKEELLKWICITHASNEPLDRVLLREKALELVCFFGLTGFKCSEAWLTVFLKRHGFSPSLTECCGPVFEDYRLWIDLIRSLFMEYPYEDQFHVDELMMYTDFLPAINQKFTEDPNKAGSSSDSQSKADVQYPDDMPRGVSCTLLLASNSSGTEKLRPLICAPYLSTNTRQDCIYHCDENAIINDELFGDWLTNLNHQMSASNRRIVVLLNRKRIGALRYTNELTHIMPLFFPNDFPTHLRPLRRDVFHYIKMIYRTKYVERLCNVSSKISQSDEIIDTLIEAWRRVPRELIVASFQRTKFREDDSLLSIECPAWDDLKIGMPFKRFVTFDDDLSDVPTFGLDPGFVMSINKSKYSFRESDNEEVSKLNDVETQSNSSRELDNSLKRPSDDSIDISTDIAYAGQHSVTPDTPEVPVTPNPGDSDQFFSARDTAEVEEVESKKITVDEKGKIEDVLNDIIDSTLNVTNTVTATSPIRGSSTPISKDYDKGLMSRVYPSPERTSSCQQHIASIADHCFEEVSKTLENKLMDLEKTCEADTYQDDIQRRQLNDYYDDTETAGTSKEGLDESFILQQIDQRLAEDIFTDKMNEKSMEIARNALNEIEKIKKELRGNGDDCCTEENKRKRDLENTIDRHDSVENSELPLGKRIRTENWAKRYEKQLVFGPDRLDVCCEKNNESGDHLEDIRQSHIEQSNNQEIEKKSIFTFSDNTSGPSTSSHEK